MDRNDNGSGGSIDLKKEETVVEKTGNIFEDDENAFVYVGPSIPGIAMKDTIYVNAIPEKLQSFIETNQIFKFLIIPLESFAAVFAEIKRGSGSMAALFNQAKEIIDRRD